MIFAERPVPMIPRYQDIQLLPGKTRKQKRKTEKNRKTRSFDAQNLCPLGALLLNSFDDAACRNTQR